MDQSHLSLLQKDHLIRRTDSRLFRRMKKTSGRLAFRSLAKLLKEKKKKEETSVKTPEILVRLQVPPRHEVQHAGGLRPQQPGHRRPRTGEPESEPAECSKQSGRFAAFNSTTFGESFAACRARSFDNCQFGSRVLAQSTEDNDECFAALTSRQRRQTHEGLRKAMEKEWEKFPHVEAVVVRREPRKTHC